MKVLFLKLVPNVWHVWEVKEVADAYARNFLIPKNLAKRLTPDEEKKLNDQTKKQEAQRRNLVENKHRVVEELNLKKLVFKAKTQDTWKIFWSIWEKEIIDRIFKDFKIKLEKKHIDMWPDGHLKKLWSRDIYIKLSPESMAKITITVE